MKSGRTAPDPTRENTIPEFPVVRFGDQAPTLRQQRQLGIVKPSAIKPGLFTAAASGKSSPLAPSAGSAFTPRKPQQF